MEHMSVAAGGPKGKQGWEGRRGQDGRTDTIGGVERANIDGRGWIGRTQMDGGGKCSERTGAAVWQWVDQVDKMMVDKLLAPK